MKVEQTEQLEWKGAETAAAAQDAVIRHRPLEIHLPANYHNALLSRLRTDAGPAQPEILEITGGQELLAEIAQIDGLKDFAGLVGAVSESHSRVEVVSPSPKIAIIPVVADD